MARVAQEALSGIEEQVKLDIVVTKKPEGAARYLQMTKEIGRVLTVPSILINGRPVFEQIPGVDELRQAILSMVENGEN